MNGIPVNEIQVGACFELTDYGHGKVIYVNVADDYPCVIVKFAKSYGRGEVVNGMMVKFHVIKELH